MTQHTAKTRGQFQSLKSTTFNAMVRLFDQENEAHDAGDTALANQLFAERVRLRDELMEIRKAEIAFLSSARSLTQQITALDQAIARAKRGLRDMTRLNSALQGAAQVIGVLTGLVTLVT